MKRDELIRELVRVIDPDEPPGMAANVLARSVLALVENRGAKTAALLSIQFEALLVHYPPDG
jgi:hypothetical protein